MKNKVQPQGLAAVADAAHQFHRVERMKDARITGDDKTDSGVLCPFGQTLGRGVGPEFQLTDDLLYSPGDFFIDGGDFVENTRNGGNGYVGLAGDISYAYFFFHLIKSYGISHFKFTRLVLDICGTNIPTDLNDFQSGYYVSITVNLHGITYADGTIFLA